MVICQHNDSGEIHTDFLFKNNRFRVILNNEGDELMKLEKE
jgi:hypothetical protein